MRSKERSDSARNAHALHRGRKFRRFHRAQALQGFNHGLCATHNALGSGIGTEFTVAAEGCNDDTGQKSESNIHDHRRQVVAHAWSIIFVTQNIPIDNPTDDAADKDNEGIHNALNQRHRDHVTVGNVGHFVR